LKKKVISILLIFGMFIAQLPSGIAVGEIEISENVQHNLQRLIESVLAGEIEIAKEISKNIPTNITGKYFQYKIYKVYFVNYSDMQLQIRPKNGQGYFWRSMKGACSFGKGQCENWNWNGPFNYTHWFFEYNNYTLTQKVTGAMADGFLHGNIQDVSTVDERVVRSEICEYENGMLISKQRDDEMVENTDLSDSVWMLFGVWGCDKDGFNKDVEKNLIWDELTGIDNVLDESVNVPETYSDEYFYNTLDSGAYLELPVEGLEDISNTETAVSAVKSLVDYMTEEQKVSSTGIDLATLYAETASMRAASKAVAGGEILVNAAGTKDLEDIAVRTDTETEAALQNGGIVTVRIPSKTVVLMTDETAITVRIDPDVLQTQIDKVRVETPTYALTFKLEDLKADLAEPLTFTAEDTGAGYAPSRTTRKAGTKTVVKVRLPQGKMSNPVTVSLPKETGSTTYQAVVSAGGAATASKYNPATDLMDGKVNTSGSYTVKTAERDFSDIANKSQEMQKAIRYLASKGIINGTTDTEFSPDKSINRAEIASLIVKALGKLDSAAAANFTDVARSSWYYPAAASSQKQGYIQGYEDHTFRGLTDISKIQIVSVAGRVLTKEMRYKKPANPSEYLSKYSDGIAQWAQPDVALATKQNLVVYRSDGTFSGAKNMTRGDAAIIIYRMFQRIW